jgi:hypothetical protein
VRFQTNEAVAVQDPERVLRALETCLRDVSSEVVRYGDQITLHGLGPSPKAMNYQDTTVLSVSAEDDKTIINADVSFQASAILGDVQQDEVVRSKLDHVFDQMRMQIDLESRAAMAGLKDTGSMTESSSSPLPDAPTSDNAPVVAPAALIGPTLEAKEEPASENTPIVAPTVSISPTVETKEDPTPEVVPFVAAAAAPISSTPVASAETTEDPVERIEAPAARVFLRWDEDKDKDETLVAMLRRQSQTEESEPAESRRWLWLVSAVVALFLLAGGVYFLRFRNRTDAPRAAATATAPVATTAPEQPAATKAAAPSPATGERTVTRIDAATIGPPAPPESPAPAAPKAAAADPAVWLGGWATAMSSRDPVAQASFYADPVSQYIDRKNVSHAALLQAKTADIGRRHGVWTFGVSNVVVESRTPTQATVQLVKHYMVKTGPSQVSEIFVKTRLQLKSVDGQWKIASEEELHSPAVASINPIDQ